MESGPTTVISTIIVIIIIIIISIIINCKEVKSTSRGP